MTPPGRVYPDPSGPVALHGRDPLSMPARQRKPVAARSEAVESPSAPAPAKGSVYRYEQLIHAPADSRAIPGPETAAVLAALNAGHRPNGPARVERTEARDGDTLVVWAIPVEAA